MSLLPTLFHSKSIQSTSLSIFLHIVIGVALYFGLYTTWIWEPHVKKKPPEIYIDQKPITQAKGNVSTVVIEKNKAIPPENLMPEAEESLLEFEEVLEQELNSFEIKEPKPWLPAQLRWKNSKPKKLADLNPINTDSKRENVVIEARRNHSQSPPPEYPIFAQRKGLEGVVILAIEIREDGQVTSAYITSSSGHKSLDLAAFEAVRTWKYHPASENGLPKKSIITQRIVFKLNDS